MYCAVEKRLYIKANGEIPCWCFNGENKILFNSNVKTDFIKSVYNGKSYAYIRESLKKGVAPWPELCGECPEMDVEKPFPEYSGKNRTIERVQIEPSYLCNIECVTCFTKKERKQKKNPPYNMPYGLFKKAMDDISGAGYSVGLFDIVGRGEPLLNREIWKMVAYMRHLFPKSRIVMHTNGNFRYSEEFISSGLSELIVSVDGFRAKTYMAHRKNGDLEKVFDLMRSVAKEKKKKGVGPELIWKYIMFGHNDGDAELIGAQEKAVELGVDSLLFEVTPYFGSLGPSRFIDIRELFNFPLTEPRLAHFRCPSLDTFTEGNVNNVMEEPGVADLVKRGLKNCIVFGCAPEEIIDSCLGRLSDILPGLEVNLLTPHDISTENFPRLKINLIGFSKDRYMTEKTVDAERLVGRCGTAIICSHETNLLPEKMNVYRLAKRADCERIVFFTDKGRFLEQIAAPTKEK